MYRCNNCGEFYEEGYVYHDDPSPKGVSLPSGSYTYMQCPHCGSEDWETAGSCASCGEPVAQGTILCDECREELESILREVAREMHLSTNEMQYALEEVMI